MITGIVTIALLFLPVASPFRSPDNIPRNLELPTIEGKTKVPTAPNLEFKERPQDSSIMPHHAASRKKWGVDKSCDGEYWYK